MQDGKHEGWRTGQSGEKIRNPNMATLLDKEEDDDKSTGLTTD